MQDVVHLAVSIANDGYRRISSLRIDLQPQATLNSESI